MKKWIVSAMYSVAVLGVLLAGLGAFAQPDGAAPSAAGAATALAAPATDPAALLLPSIGEISAAGTQGRWGLAVVLGIVLALRIFYKYVLKLIPAHTAFRKWADSTFGGWLLNGVLSVGTSLSAYLTATAPGAVNAAGIVGAVLGGGLLMLAGAGGNEFAKDTGIFKPAPAEPAPAPVLNSAQAAAVLDLPPKKDGE